MEVAALWGNSAFEQVEGNDDARQKYMEVIEEGYSDAIAGLYGEKQPEEDEINTDDPFWQAMERGLDKRKLPDPKVET